MKIVVAVRCRNEEKNIERFLHGYDFADSIVVSDGGSTDNSVSLLKRNGKVILHHFTEEETVGGETWNLDAPHMNFVLNKAKELEPDWVIFDDLDCAPNKRLRDRARTLLSVAQFDYLQVNAFRLYLWGDSEFFPKMNNYFKEGWTSLWAWRPSKINITADESVRHGTMIGLSATPYSIEIPMCLLHKSWHPDTIEKKVVRYNALGLNMDSPLDFAGKPEPLPDWAHE